MRRLAPVFVLWLAACAPDAVPVPRFPQVEQATEAVQGGGERYRAHRTCAPDARTVDQLVTCMRAAGFEFVERRPSYPEADCWQDRDRGDLERITPQCFVGTGARRPPAAP
jgi:hypothetical protein